MIQIVDKVYAVEVPDDATSIEICNYGLNDALEWVHYIDGVAAYCVDDLPPGTWQFLFTTKTATEEDARKVVRELPVGARYENYNGDYPVWYHTGRDSLRSLLRSKGLDPNKNYALIEKQNTNGAE